MDTNRTIAHLGAEIAEKRESLLQRDREIDALRERLHVLEHELDVVTGHRDYCLEVIARVGDYSYIPNPEDVDVYEGEFARPDNGNPRQIIGGVVHMLPAYTSSESG